MMEAINVCSETDAERLKRRIAVWGWVCWGIGFLAGAWVAALIMFLV